MQVYLLPLPNGHSRKVIFREHRANPADLSTRLIYADWLQDNGDPVRAEFIRLQIGLTNHPWNLPRIDNIFVSEVTRDHTSTYPPVYADLDYSFGPPSRAHIKGFAFNFIYVDISKYVHVEMERREGLNYFIFPKCVVNVRNFTPNPQKTDLEFIAEYLTAQEVIWEKEIRALRSRITQLLVYKRQWVPPINATGSNTFDISFGYGDAIFRNGFVEELSLPCSIRLHSHSELLDSYPIKKVKVSGLRSIPLSTIKQYLKEPEKSFMFDTLLEMDSVKRKLFLLTEIWPKITFEMIGF